MTSLGKARIINLRFMFKPLRMLIEITLELLGSVLLDKFNGINFCYISFLPPHPHPQFPKRRQIVFHPSSLSCTSLEDIDVITPSDSFL
jgi:hypothetical protein